MLLAQLGSYVPADACTLTPMRALYTRMGAADQLCRGRSTLQNELTEAAEALRGLGPRTLLLLDELGRGTSTHDGAAIAHATLDHLAARRGALCIFVTHHPAVAALATARPAAIRLCHMASIQGGGAPASTVAGSVTAQSRSGAGEGCGSVVSNSLRRRDLGQDLFTTTVGTSSPTAT